MVVQLQPGGEENLAADFFLGASLLGLSASAFGLRDEPKEGRHLGPSVVSFRYHVPRVERVCVLGTIGPPKECVTYSVSLWGCGTYYIT
jgi:hypothetical protein